MKVLRATAHSVPDLEGTHLDASSFDTLIVGEAVTVVQPDGSPLLVYQPNVLSAGLCRTAFDVFRRVSVGTTNRGQAAGRIEGPEVNGQLVAAASGTRYRRVKADGTASDTTYAQKVPSANVGFLDRDPRFPFCRQTAFNAHHAAKFRRALPFVRAVDGVFRQTLPARHAAQMDAISRTPAEFTIKGTAFTTITVNHNWATAVHRDAGDLRAGFGVMAVLDAGTYEGGYLVFPEYRVAVDMRVGGVCLADVHELHGNSPIVGRPGHYFRCSLVFYFRERMTACLPAPAEASRARCQASGT